MRRAIMRVEPPKPLVAMALAALSIGIFNMFAWREAKAKALYLDHCDVALANPRFSNPELGKLDIEAKTFDGDAESFERYEWYVARLAYVLDECLKLAPKPHWYRTALTQLANHKAYFASDYYHRQEYLPHYSKRMRILIARTARSS